MLRDPLTHYMALSCCLCTTVLTIFQICQHLRNYTEPVFQRYTIRILFMIYNFMSLCMAYVGGPGAVVVQSEGKVIEPSWLLCTCCWAPIPINGFFLRRCKQGTLQFVILKPFLAAITLILFVVGKYNPYKPLLKFVCFKSVIFLTFWQSLAVSMSPSDSEALMNWLIVIEMMFASIGMFYAFPYSEYKIGGAASGWSWGAFTHAVSISDVTSDILHQFNPAYQPYVLYTDGGPAQNVKKRKFRGGGRNKILDASDFVGFFTAKGGITKKKNQTEWPDLENATMDEDGTMWYTTKKQTRLTDMVTDKVSQMLHRPENLVNWIPGITDKERDQAELLDSESDAEYDDDALNAHTLSPSNALGRRGMRLGSDSGSDDFVEVILHPAAAESSSAMNKLAVAGDEESIFDSLACAARNKTQQSDLFLAAVYGKPVPGLGDTRAVQTQLQVASSADNAMFDELVRGSVGHTPVSSPAHLPLQEREAMVSPTATRKVGTSATTTSLVAGSPTGPPVAATPDDAGSPTAAPVAATPDDAGSTTQRVGASHTPESSPTQFPLQVQEEMGTPTAKPVSATPDGAGSSSTKRKTGTPAAPSFDADSPTTAPQADPSPVAGPSGTWPEEGAGHEAGEGSVRSGGEVVTPATPSFDSDSPTVAPQAGPSPVAEPSGTGSEEGAGHKAGEGSVRSGGEVVTPATPSFDSDSPTVAPQAGPSPVAEPSGTGSEEGAGHEAGEGSVRSGGEVVTPATPSFDSDSPTVAPQAGPSPVAGPSGTGSEEGARHKAEEGSVRVGDEVGGSARSTDGAGASEGGTLGRVSHAGGDDGAEASHGLGGSDAHSPCEGELASGLDAAVSEGVEREATIEVASGSAGSDASDAIVARGVSEGVEMESAVESTGGSAGCHDSAERDANDTSGVGEGTEREATIEAAGGSAGRDARDGSAATGVMGVAGSKIAEVASAPGGEGAASLSRGASARVSLSHGASGNMGEGGSEKGEETGARGPPQMKRTASKKGGKGKGKKKK
eukprot:gene28107-31215_t